MQNDFTVYTNGRGFGGLTVSMEGPSRADIRYDDNRDGSVKVVYIPRVPGEYKITVKFDGISVRGSPYTVRVRGDDVSGIRASTYSSASSRDPFGLDTRLESLLDSHDSHPRTSRSVANVRVSGRGLYSGITNVQNEITVDVKDAGSGRLHYSIAGPGNVESKNHGLYDGHYRIYYKPDRSGEYSITMRYNDQEVLGSPFKVRVI